MADQNLVRLSKWMSLVLRHDPAKFGVVLDEAGWTRVDDLIAAAARADVPLDDATLRRAVAENDKQRFALSGDGAMIRASQGHSVQVELGLEPAEPPPILFHGTATRFLDSIRRDGLVPGSRRDVHLSADPDTATTVGARHGRPAVLRIDAARMHAGGRLFFRSANGVWLTDAVPAEYLGFPDDN
ncbi:MAG TPA: RNA 2'-phosphotransferase [Longimicrobium sp.]|nr:RNA 2'-phosphotransferase [Longimicrobium sp.]